MAVRVNAETFATEVLQAEGLVLVDFYSDSCVACKKLAPVLGNAEDDYEDKVKVYKVNTNFDVELAEQYEEKSTDSVSHIVSILEPTIVIVLSILVGLVLLSVMMPLLGLLSEMIA